MTVACGSPHFHDLCGDRVCPVQPEVRFYLGWASHVGRVLEVGAVSGRRLCV